MRGGIKISKALKETLTVLLITVIAYCVVIHLMMSNLTEDNAVVSLALILIPITFKFFFNNIYEILFDYKGNNSYKNEKEYLSLWLDLGIMTVILHTLFYYLNKESFWIGALLSAVILSLGFYVLFTISKRKRYLEKKNK